MVRCPSWTWPSWKTLKLKLILNIKDPWSNKTEPKWVMVPLNWTIRNFTSPLSSKVIPLGLSFHTLPIGVCFSKTSFLWPTSIYYPPFFKLNHWFPKWVIGFPTSGSRNHLWKSELNHRNSILAKSKKVLPKGCRYWNRFVSIAPKSHYLFHF